MRTSILVSLGALSMAQAFTPAAVVKQNVPHKTYVATLEPKAGAEFAISGSVQGVASANGQGVDWTISVSGFDPSKGPFAYHIHDQPVDATGNCSSTKAHLDPTLRGESPPCDKATPALCQVGDLAGKYGKISTASFSTAYHDDFTSTSAGNPAFFGNRSVTFHLPDKKRIACANFKLVEHTASGATGSAPYPMGTGAPQPMPSGTAASSGYGYPIGTGTGPYPTGNSGSGSSPSGPAVPSGPSASSVVPGAGGASTGAPAVPTGAASSVRGGVAAVAVAIGFAVLLV